MSLTGLLILVAILAGGGLLIFLFDRLFRPDEQKPDDEGSLLDAWAPADCDGDADGGD